MAKQIEILYMDADLVVVHKPAGVDSEAAKGFSEDMISLLKKELVRRGEKNPYIGVVHRLDKPVEGLLLYARNEASCAKLCKMIEERRVHKEYCALVHGVVSEAEKLTDQLYTDRETRMAHVVENTTSEANRKMAKRACLTYANAGEKNRIYTTFAKVLDDHGAVWSKNPLTASIVIEDLLSGDQESHVISGVRIDLETGRYHQIRAQLSHRGFPIVGDRRYGKTTAVDEIFSYPALCAYALSLVHPVTGEAMHFQLQ